MKRKQFHKVLKFQFRGFLYVKKKKESSLAQNQNQNGTALFIDRFTYFSKEKTGLCVKWF